jgi:hypothetical protein
MNWIKPENHFTLLSLLRLIFQTLTASVSCRSGTFGVSNHPHDAPYRKSLLGKQILEDIIDGSSRRNNQQPYMCTAVLRIRDIFVRIRASEQWIRILLFSSLTFKTPTKKGFILAF